MIDLITDRTEADVLLGTDKGSYCASDLNRVEKAVEELCTNAKALGVTFDPEIKTDWGRPGEFSASEWPTNQQMTRYLSNVSQLCEKVEIAANLPSSMEKLNWKGANQIEEALNLVYTRIQNVIQTLRYSGEFYSGEEYGL